jgi:hypothetical protein
MYRTSPKKDIRYLVETVSDAYELDPDEVPSRSWRYGCDYRVVHKFEAPLTLGVMRKDTVLGRWWVLRRNFQGIGFQVEQEYWDRLCRLLVGGNPGSRPLLARDTPPVDQPVPVTDAIPSQPDPEVERAAVRFVVRWYAKKGFSAVSVESERVGYDLVCTKGKQERHVEVKGLSGGKAPFVVTANELSSASKDDAFEICIVTRALTGRPVLERLSGARFRELYSISPIQYRATPRESAIEGQR